MSSATIVSEAYGEGACLYETVLGVSRDASASELRKAYYKKCLTYHPDKLSTELSNDDKELAKKKFQAISLAYAILSDDEKRKEYDESGELYGDDDDFATSKDGENPWTEYFNNLFPKVTTADIEAFEVKYKCSDEEEADVLKYYSQFKGDLNKMVECVMLSSDVDKERWVKDYIGPAVERGDVVDYMAKIQKTMGSAPTKKRQNRKPTRTSRKKKAEEDEMEEEASDSESDTPMAQVVDEMDDDDDDDEDDEADVRTKRNNKTSTKSSKTSSASSTSASAKKKSSTSKGAKSTKKSSNGDDDLIAQIRGNALARRKAGFDSIMAGLEERYCGDKKKSGKKRQQKKDDDGDIDDDEFARIQAKMMKNKESKKRQK